MFLLQEPAITWVKVEKLTFDLVGVVLGSFKLAGILLVAALLVGVLTGVVLVLSRRRATSAPPLDDVSLHLDSQGWPEPGPGPGQEAVRRRGERPPPRGPAGAPAPERHRTASLRHSD
jgi:hypothetical protein